MASRLTAAERNFIDALIENDKLYGSKGFLQTMFLAWFKDDVAIRNDLGNLFEGDYVDLFKNSTMLMESIQCCYIGKHHNHFWGTGSEGELFGLGKEIHNIPFILISAEIGDLESAGELPHIVEHYAKHYGVDYHDQVAAYKDFCSRFGLTYTENHDYIQRQADEFGQSISSI